MKISTLRKFDRQILTKKSNRREVDHLASAINNFNAAFSIKNISLYQHRKRNKNLGFAAVPMGIALVIASPFMGLAHGSKYASKSFAEGRESIIDGTLSGIKNTADAAVHSVAALIDYVV